MSSPRQNVTYQQRLGFEDTDLKSSAHDQIMLWLDRSGVEAFVRQLKIENWSQEEIDRQIEITDRAIENTRDTYSKFNRTDESHRSIVRKLDEMSHLGARTLLGSPPERRLLYYDKIWEYPVMNKGYTVGFVDMFIRCRLPQELYVSNLDDNCPYDRQRTHIKVGNGRTDAPVILPEWSYHLAQFKLCFEVKSKITSLGELIRQIRLYQTYISERDCPSRFVLVSPDKNYEESLRSQGIPFLEYNP